MTFEPQLEPQLEPELLGLAPDGPRVVAIGGGHGLAQALVGIQSYASRIDAVVSVADDGGSSGRLAEPLGIPPPGDIRRCLLALTPEPSIWGELLGYRFDRADIAGHSLGNMMLAALADIAGGFGNALQLCGELLGTNGQVLPVSEQLLELCAQTDSGWVRGQVAVENHDGPITRLEVTPAGAHVNPAVLDAVVGADQIVLAPGSLYTSLLANLVVPGLVEAINRSSASLVYVMNLVTQQAETIGMDGYDHVLALSGVGGLNVRGVVLTESGSVRVAEGLDRVSISEAEFDGWTVVGAELVDHEASWPQHDPFKLGAALARLMGV